MRSSSGQSLGAGAGRTEGGRFIARRVYHGSVEDLTQLVDALARAWGPADAPSNEVARAFLEGCRAHVAESRLVVADFAAFVAVRSGSPPRLEPARAADLAIAFGCTRGAKASIEALERTFGERLRGALRKMGLSQSDVEAAMQKARTELLVAAPGTEPRIARYGGQGELGGWLRVTVTRSALKMFRGARSTSLEEERLGDQLAGAGGGGPELSYMRELYRPVFRAAFREALAGLETEERMLLKQSMLDGLSIDRLAEMHGVHRATVARRIARAREDLVSGTRKRFQAEARVTPAECESIFRALGDAFEVTLQRLAE